MVASGAVPSGVAAGHPATATAGIEILEAGGTPADAPGPAPLPPSGARTLMKGVLGGGHAVYWDGGEAWNLDCFVDVPTGRGADPVELQVPFGEELVHYAVGPGTCAVPGLPRGLAALHERFGRLPWERLVEAAWAGRRVFTRAGLSGVPETLARLPALHGLGETARAHVLLAALDGPAVE